MWQLRLLGRARKAGNGGSEGRADRGRARLRGTRSRRVPLPLSNQRHRPLPRRPRVGLTGPNVGAHRYIQSRTPVGALRRAAGPDSACGPASRESRTQAVDMTTAGPAMTWSPYGTPTRRLRPRLHRLSVRPSVSAVIARPPPGHSRGSPCPASAAWSRMAAVGQVDDGEEGQVTENDSVAAFFRVLYTTRALRRLKPNPVPEEVLFQLIDAAIRAPSGQNAQDWRFIVVTDTAIKQSMQEAATAAWARYQPRFAEQPDLIDELPRTKRLSLRATEHLAHHVGEAPAVIVACGLQGRHSTPGGSIFPAVQNLLLAARALGLRRLDLSTRAIESRRDGARCAGRLPGVLRHPCRLPGRSSRPGEAQTRAASRVSRPLGRTMAVRGEPDG